MTELPIPLRSNPGAFRLQGEPRIINAYPQNEGDELKARNVLVPVSGQTRFGGSLDLLSPCRGMIFIQEENEFYCVAGFGLHSVDANGTGTKLLTVAGGGNVYFARNDAETVQTVCVIEGRAYIIEGGTATYTPYSFTPKGVTFCGGYFVFWEDKGRFWVSALRDTTVDGLSFATAEGDPDGLIKVHGSLNTLYLVGERTIEIWQVTGADFPFAKVGGAHLRFGSLSPHTIKDYANGVALVANDNQVYLINGFNHSVISSNEVCRLIESEADKSAITAFTYNRDGNKFYTLQGTGWTREYNSTTGTWADRRTGPVGQWDALHAIEAWGKTIFGSQSGGQFSEADTSLFTENGLELIWGFDTTIFHASPKGLYFGRVDIDVETGHGDPTDDEPLLMLSWSDDNGRTTKETRHLGIGYRGNYKKSVRTNRLGSCNEKGRQFSIRISDPVIRGISGMYVEASQVTR